MKDTIKSIIRAALLCTTCAHLAQGRPTWEPHEISTLSYLSYERTNHFPPSPLAQTNQDNSATSAAWEFLTGKSDGDANPALAHWRKSYEGADFYLTTSIRMSPDYQIVRVTGCEPGSGRSLGREWLPLQRDKKGSWSIGSFPQTTEFALFLSSAAKRETKRLVERAGQITAKPRADAWMTGLEGEGWSLEPLRASPVKSAVPSIPKQEARSQSSLLLKRKHRTYLSSSGFRLLLAPGTTLPLLDGHKGSIGKATGALFVHLTDKLRERKVGALDVETSRIMRCGRFSSCRYRVASSDNWTTAVVASDEAGVFQSVDEEKVPPIVLAWHMAQNGVLHWDAFRNRPISEADIATTNGRNP